MERILAIKNQYTNKLLSISGVVAVGIGYKKVGGERTEDLSIVVSVQKKVPQPREMVPRYLGGIPTDVQETGTIRALRTGQYRPAPGGVSIGHKDITAGTLGCLVNEGTLILSNNHVLANSNKGLPGDLILQPGPYDGGTMERDLIATLCRFVPIEFGCPIAEGAVNVCNTLAKVIGSRHRLRTLGDGNLVDAALATPMSLDLVTPEILEIGEPVGIAEAELGMHIIKSGRTTGLTEGVVEQVSVTANVLYEYQMATFVDQVMAGPMCAGGDSGSMVLNNREVVGLLFAGSEQTTLMNRIQNVVGLLGVTVP